MSVTGLSQIHVTVDDIEEAVAFYRDVLGLRFLFDVPDQNMAFFDVGGIRLYLGKAESPEFASAPLLYFEVDDIDGEHNRLTQSGVEFISEPHRVHQTEQYELWMAFFETPAGHVNALSEQRSV